MAFQHTPSHRHQLPTWPSTGKAVRQIKFLKNLAVAQWLLTRMCLLIIKCSYYTGTYIHMCIFKDL